MQTKSCTNPKCEQVNPQPVTEFYKGYNKDGYRSYCKSCWRPDPDKRKEYYQANKHKINEQNLNNYRANMEQRKGQVRRWEKENREKIRTRRREYYRKHPEVSLSHDHKRRALVAGNGGSYTAEEWKALCDYYGNKCLACGESKPLTVDHVVPVTKGGRSDISNLQPLCITCNKSKGTRIIDYRLGFASD